MHKKLENFVKNSEKSSENSRKIGKMLKNPRTNQKIPKISEIFLVIANY
jgi:hypothetical protein